MRNSASIAGGHRRTLGHRAPAMLALCAALWLSGQVALSTGVAAAAPVSDSAVATTPVDGGRAELVVVPYAALSPATRAGAIRTAADPDFLNVQGHHCLSMGNDGAREGVHCADTAFEGTLSDVEAWGVGASLCQTLTKVVLQCAGIRQNVGLYAAGPNGAVPLARHQWNCGRYGGSACPRPQDGRFQNGSGHTLVHIPFGGCIEMWAALVDDYITLPQSARKLGPGPNVAASPHSLLCNA